MFYVSSNGRLLFKLSQEPGVLVGKRELPCGFASGESMYAKTEETILALAEKAKDWDGFIFKLRLEGWTVEPRLPLGKL